MAAFQPVEFNYRDKKKIRETFLEFLVESINECTQPLLTLRMTEYVDQALIHGHSYMEQMPIEFKLYGPDKVESLLFMSKVREINGYDMLDLLINNWYFVTLKFSIDTFPLGMNVYYRCLQNKFGFKTQMRNGYPCEDVSADDILDVLTFAHCNDMYMSCLERLVKETEDLDKVRFLFDGLNHDTMNPDYMELKMMCMRRLREVDDNGTIKL